MITDYRIYIVDGSADPLLYICSLCMYVCMYVCAGEDRLPGEEVCSA